MEAFAFAIKVVTADCHVAIHLVCVSHNDGKQAVRASIMTKHYTAELICSGCLMSSIPTLHYCHQTIVHCSTAKLEGGRYQNYADYAGSEVLQWAEKFNADERRHQFLSIWGFVRLQLAQAMQCSFDAILFARTQHNKPYIASTNPGQWAFNLSHTKDDVLLSYGRGFATCGVDLEQPRPMVDMAAIVNRFYAPEEAGYFATLSTEQEQTDYFYRLWVIKEAVLKACGLGLSFGLQHVVVGALDAEIRQGMITLPQHNKPYYWQLLALPKVPFPAAIAATRPFIVGEDY
jgi:4'-phosphopantetheinyl transferase